MSWKTEILERVRRKVKTIDRYSAKGEEALAHGDKDRAKYLSIKGDKLEMWLWGALDALETIGYEIKYNDDGNVESINGDFTQEYRVRYEKTDINEIASLVCRSSVEVCAVIDRCKEFGSEYKALGIDTRIVFPNGECSGWNKILDF